MSQKRLKIVFLFAFFPIRNLYCEKSKLSFGFGFGIFEIRYEKMDPCFFGKTKSLLLYGQAFILYLDIHNKHIKAPAIVNAELREAIKK